MNRDMPCEPIEVQPQRDILIGTLKIPEEKKNTHDALDDFRQKITYGLESYDILPLMHDENQRLQVSLSLRTNTYLKLRWDKFVENGSRACVQLRLYRDYKMDLMKSNDVAMIDSGGNEERENAEAIIRSTMSGDCDIKIPSKLNSRLKLIDMSFCYSKEELLRSRNSILEGQNRNNICNIQTR
uniref:Uncharacterized protein n=1 Tax=Glossina austeni TaxID=7395 RepID=A0A1A9UYZ7_GLOAU